MRMNMRDVFESQLKTLKDDMIEMGSMIEKADWKTRSAL